MEMVPPRSRRMDLFFVWRFVRYIVPWDLPVLFPRLMKHCNLVVENIDYIPSRTSFETFFLCLLGAGPRPLIPCFLGTRKFGWNMFSSIHRWRRSASYPRTGEPADPVQLQKARGLLFEASVIIRGSVVMLPYIFQYLNEYAPEGWYAGGAARCTYKRSAKRCWV